jgi:hypothetical protein
VEGEGTEQAIGAELPQARCLGLRGPDAGGGLAGGGLADDVLLDDPARDLAARYTGYAQQLLELLRRIMASKPRQAVLVQLVVPSQGVGASMGGLLGLLKSAQQENPRLL